MWFVATTSWIGMMVVKGECECKDVGESYLVTRLWDIVSPNWDDQKVIAEFNEGFAPSVTQMTGFQEYLSSTTGVPDTVFFMNIFESKETAKTAQDGAKAFVKNGVLNGTISPNQFTESDFAFYFSTQECNNCRIKASTWLQHCGHLPKTL
jgi:hypothetical protein